jgi:nicotinate-nucleotide adenylyltransferase
MRIGLLGGSFDPPPNGHLLAAGDVYDALGLDRVVWIPAAVQPLKAGQAGATSDQRLMMVRHLVGGDPRFGVSAIEIERGGLSYTVDTLRTLVAESPAAELFWLVGADVVQSFGKWREPERIVELATVVVMTRAGDFEPGLAVVPGRSIEVATRRVDISSTEIRQRVKEGKSIRGFVPDAVAAYIASERLYR